jgi:hypothetical protein
VIENRFPNIKIKTSCSSIQVCALQENKELKQLLDEKEMNDKWLINKILPRILSKIDKALIKECFTRSINNESEMYYRYYEGDLDSVLKKQVETAVMEKIDSLFPEQYQIKVEAVKGNCVRFSW